MVCFWSNLLCFLSTIAIDYYIVNLHFILLFIMDSFLVMLKSRALLILTAHSVLLGFYSILGVLVLWKCYRAQHIWFILCLVMFKLSDDIYMSLVDATLDGEMPHGFIYSNWIWRSYLKCDFLGSCFAIIIRYKALMRVYMFIYYVYYCCVLGCL